MSNEALKQLEARLAHVEEELRQLKAARAQVPWWERTAGMFKGSKAFAEIVRLGRRIRRQDRPLPA